MTEPLVGVKIIEIAEFGAVGVMHIELPKSRGQQKLSPPARQSRNNRPRPEHAASGSLIAANPPR